MASEITSPARPAEKPAPSSPPRSERATRIDSSVDSVRAIVADKRGDWTNFLDEKPEGESKLCEEIKKLLSLYD